MLITFNLNEIHINEFFDIQNSLSASISYFSVSIRTHLNALKL